MGKALLIATLSSCLLWACGQTPEQKAQDAIKRYLESTLNDPSSYEPGFFGSLDSLFESPNGRVPEYDSLYQLSRCYFDENGKTPYDKQLDSIEQANRGEFIGYTMLHLYRATNKMGGMVKESGLFYMDKNLSCAHDSESALIEFEEHIRNITDDK